MNKEDTKPYIYRQLDAEMRWPTAREPAICVTTAIGHEGLMVRGGPVMPLGCQVDLTIFGDHRQSLSIRCIGEGVCEGDQIFRYEGLGFAQRARLEELIRPHWDGVDLLDGLMTMSCLYGATTLKDWLCMTSLLERLQPHLVNRHSVLA